MKGPSQCKGACMTDGSKSLRAFSVLLSLLLSGCASSATSNAKSHAAPPAASVAGSPIACGDPTPLVSSESIGERGSTAWAVAGPLRFAVYGLHGFRPGVPTKVPIAVEKPLERNVTLKGWRCSDGRPLRFWYERGGLPFPVQYARDDAGNLTMVPDVRAIETAGDPIATLEAPRFPGSGINAYGGYFLFTTPGKWKVSAFQGDQLLASVILLVS